MKLEQLIRIGALLVAVTLSACGRVDAPDDATAEDAPVDERMSPASQNRPPDADADPSHPQGDPN